MKCFVCVTLNDAGEACSFLDDVLGSFGNNLDESSMCSWNNFVGSWEGSPLFQVLWIMALTVVHVPQLRSAFMIQ